MPSVKAGAVRTITPKMMMTQMANIPHRLSLNIWNFEASAGKIAVKVFKGSFDKGRLNSSNSPAWQARQRSYSHPILNESGLMKNSIKWRRKGGEEAGLGERGVEVFSDPKDFGRAKRHPGYYYAKHHHLGITRGVDDATYDMPARPFIGDSDILEKELNKLLPKLFVGLP